MAQNLRQPVQGCLQVGSAGAFNDLAESCVRSFRPHDGRNIIQEKCFQTYPNNENRVSQRVFFQGSILKCLHHSLETQPDLSVTFASRLRICTLQGSRVESLHLATDADRKGT